jgi:hypothetical protein
MINEVMACCTVYARFCLGGGAGVTGDSCIGYYDNVNSMLIIRQVRQGKFDGPGNDMSSFQKQCKIHLISMPYGFEAL